MKNQSNFFTYETYEDWKNRVLRLLKRKHSVIHKIVDQGCLPIFSLKTNKWFGVKASLRYLYQRLPKDVPKELKWRWLLRDLLESGKHMTPSAKYVLCGYGNDVPFCVRYETDWLVGQDPVVYNRLHIESIYPREQQMIPWLRGGDLLHACGILFSLLDVRYMTVQDCADLRKNNTDQPISQGYSYYDKVILAPAEQIRYDSDFEDYEHTRVFRLPGNLQKMSRHWMWDKSRTNRKPQSIL